MSFLAVTRQLVNLSSNIFLHYLQADANFLSWADSSSFKNNRSFSEVDRMIRHVTLSYDSSRNAISFHVNQGRMKGRESFEKLVFNVAQLLKATLGYITMVNYISALPCLKD